MLILMRKPGQAVRLRHTTTGEIIWMVVTEIRRDQMRVGIEAHEDYEIVREEILPPEERRPNREFVPGK